MHICEHICMYYVYVHMYVCMYIWEYVIATVHMWSLGDKLLKFSLCILSSSHPVGLGAETQAIGLSSKGLYLLSCLVNTLLFCLFVCFVLFFLFLFSETGFLCGFGACPELALVD